MTKDYGYVTLRPKTDVEGHEVFTCDNCAITSGVAIVFFLT